MSIKIATHNAKFHTDDVFAVSALLLLYPEAEIIRTRDENIIEGADMVVDVGNIYNESKNRFDHHQLGGAGERENGIPYSSFGLVWKKFGEKITSSKKVAERIDKSLVQAIDAGDNGVDLFKPILPGVTPYLIHGVVDQYRLTWKEKDNWDDRFKQSVEWAKNFLNRIIKIEGDWLEGENIVREVYVSAPDKRLIIIDEQYDLGRELVTKVLTKLPEPIYALLYRHDHENWQIVAVRKEENTFDLRKPLPENWRAKKEKELDEVTGVEGGIFCHLKGFMCVVKTKEAAVKLAEIALNS